MLALADNPHKSITAELVIHEFDQWSNARNGAIAPTSICWFAEFEGSVE